MTYAWQKLDEARQLLFEAEQEIRSSNKEDNKDLLNKLSDLNMGLASAAFTAHERSL